MTGYEYQKEWTGFAYGNAEVKPVHHALYYACVNLCNTLGWPPEFGVPTDRTMASIGISSYKTYKKAFDDLDKWGMIHVISRSTNQFTSNRIALVKSTKATTKATTKAGTKAITKAITKANDEDFESFGKKYQSTIQSNYQSNYQSIVSIIKHLNTKTLKHLYSFIALITSRDQHEKEIEFFAKNFDSVWNQVFEGVQHEKAENELYVRMLEIYFVWFEKMNSVKPKMTAIAGRKMKSIIRYLKTQNKIKTDDDVVEAWQALLDNWHLLEGHQNNYLYNKMDLKDIDSNINEIVSIMRTKAKGNGKGTKKNTGSRGWAD